jgi:hypothetical protein
MLARRFVLVVVFMVLPALTAAGLGGAALAQTLPWVGPFSRGYGPIAPGMMLGPASTGRAVTLQMCHPAIAGFSEWRIERVEEVVKPTEQQRARFEELKAASAKAIELMHEACPDAVPFTVAEKMEAMERRLTAMLRAVRTLRAALDAFYAALSHEQRAQFDTAAITPGGLRRRL